MQTLIVIDCQPKAAHAHSSPNRIRFWHQRGVELCPCRAFLIGDRFCALAARFVAKFMSCCQPECRCRYCWYSIRRCVLQLLAGAVEISWPYLHLISVYYLCPFEFPAPAGQAYPVLHKKLFQFLFHGPGAISLPKRRGDTEPVVCRVIAFCVGEFKWKWIQYCIFTPKCFQKQIFHLHFLNGAIRITYPTGPKHWFCSCASNGPPSGRPSWQDWVKGSLRRDVPSSPLRDGHWQYLSMQRLFGFWMPFVGQRTTFRTLFHYLFLLKLINNVQEIKGKSIWVVKGFSLAPGQSRASDLFLIKRTRLYPWFPHLKISPPGPDVPGVFDIFSILCIQRRAKFIYCHRNYGVSYPQWRMIYILMAVASFFPQRPFCQIRHDFLMYSSDTDSIRCDSFLSF